MPSELSDRPELEKLERSLQRLLNERGEELAFVVLFGSMARGDWSLGSDYDLFIGLETEDELCFIDRIAEFEALVEPGVEVFPYSRSEWQRMFREFHPLLLEVLEHGVALWDQGAFAEMQQIFRRWRESGQVTPWRSGWKIQAPT